MIVKRETKRKFRKSFSIITVLFVSVTLMVAIFLVGRVVIPLISYGENSSDNLIRPLATTTTIAQLRSKLSDKNIKLTSFEDASESGLFTAVIKDGPKVLFSKNQDSKWQVNSLALILQRTTIENKKPVLIDLTSNRPIVKF